MWFFKKEQLPNITRNFSASYLKDKVAQQEFVQKGYTVLRNVIDNKEIAVIKEKFKLLKEMDGYNLDTKFESSGNFTSKPLQEFVFKSMNEIMQGVAPRIAQLDQCDIGDGGAFFLKPNSKNKSVLHPHQDSAVIDETNCYGMFVWIPVADIGLDNGPLYVLPKSHLWGNCARSQHIPWAFRKQYQFLWKKMIPIPINKGDVICFDTSLIHASGENNSDEIRVVACGALLPKNHQKIEYLDEGKDIYMYKIKDDYWLDGGLKESLKKYKKTKIDYKFPNPVSKKSIERLLSSYN